MRRSVIVVVFIFVSMVLAPESEAATCAWINGQDGKFHNAEAYLRVNAGVDAGSLAYGGSLIEHWYNCQSDHFIIVTHGTELEIWDENEVVQERFKGGALDLDFGDCFVGFGEGTNPPPPLDEQYEPYQLPTLGHQVVDLWACYAGRIPEPTMGNIAWPDGRSVAQTMVEDVLQNAGTVNIAPQGKYWWGACLRFRFPEQGHDAATILAAVNAHAQALGYMDAADWLDSTTYEDANPDNPDHATIIQDMGQVVTEFNEEHGTRYILADPPVTYCLEVAGSAARRVGGPALQSAFAVNDTVWVEDEVCFCELVEPKTCAAQGPTPVESTSWGTVKEIFR